MFGAWLVRPAAVTKAVKLPLCAARQNPPNQSYKKAAEHQLAYRALLHFYTV
jgi:hypothetical protein